MMKRIFLLGALAAVALSLGGCFLVVGSSSHDVRYVARLTGVAGEAMNITVNDENGKPQQFNGVGSSFWSYSFTVDTFEPYLAFIEADGNFFADSVYVEIQVDGRTRITNADLTVPYPTVNASWLVD